MTMTDPTPDEIRKAASVHDWVHNKLAVLRGVRGLNGQDLREYADFLEERYETEA